MKDPVMHEILTKNNNKNYYYYYKEVDQYQGFSKWNTNKEFISMKQWKQTTTIQKYIKSDPR